jgi:ribonuclease VapC
VGNRFREKKREKQRAKARNAGLKDRDAPEPPDLLPSGKICRPAAVCLAQARNTVDAFVIEIAGKEIAISGDIGNRAIEASMKYGKAVGHSADLNFGDCFAYACAKGSRLSLLYKGNDFSKTDLA